MVDNKKTIRDGVSRELRRSVNVSEANSIGVLALQGAFFEHIQMLKKLSIETREVRQKKDLEGLSGLIIPGGESTTMSLLMKNKSLRDGVSPELRRSANVSGANSLRNELINLIKEGLPVFGTCAGAILLAKKVEGKKLSESLLLMDIEIERNAYGSQLDSFEEEIALDLDNTRKQFNAIFIRAPKISKIGKHVDILAKNSAGEIVMAREKNMLVTTFHPELTSDSLVHEYFIQMLSTAWKR